MPHPLTRRSLFAIAPATLLAGRALAEATNFSSPASLAPARPADEPFGYCLNTSTVRGHKLTLLKEAELAAKAGFHALEPWISELDDHVKSNGKLEDLGKSIADLGLTVESAIGFFEWAVDDNAKRAKALDEAARNMELVKKIGGKRLAAPPVGCTNRDDMNPKVLGERYRALLELGDKIGVVPEVEVWGFSKTLQTLGEAAHVAIAADHPSSCILADVYHMYKGGSGFHGLKLLNKNAMHVIHMNDYPADPPREKINDSERVYPGDGVAPLKQIFKDLHAIGFDGYLSIELFNKTYYAQDAETVLATAIAKLRTVVKSAFA